MRERAGASPLQSSLVAAAVLAVCGIVASLEPLLGDCWFGVLWRRDDRSLAEVMLWNYRSYNPRIGETMLYVTSGYPAVHVVVTPVVVLATLVALVTLSLGRLPRLRNPDDAGALLVAVAACCSIASIGAILFYRPYATNYLYGFALQAWSLVPLRLQTPTASRLRVLGLGVLGVAAGLSNEHTGPTLIAASAVLGIIWLRRDRRAWPRVVATLVGQVSGFVALFLSPAQLQRHGGRGRASILERVLALDAHDLVRLVKMAVLEAAGPLLALVLAVVVHRIARSRGRAGEWPTRTIAGLLLAALAIVATLVASPVREERLFLAPSLLVAAAALVALRAAFDTLASRRRLVVVAGIVAVVHAVGFVCAQYKLHADYSVRDRLLASADRTEVIFVPPSRELRESHWLFGDELRKPGWRAWRALIHGCPILALDTEDPGILAESGVPIAWTLDNRIVSGTTLPPLHHFDAASLARASAEAREHRPAPSHGELCLRLFLPPSIVAREIVCLERYRDGVPGAATRMLSTPLGLVLACDGASCLVSATPHRGH